MKINRGRILTLNDLSTGDIFSFRDDESQAVYMICYDEANYQYRIIDMDDAHIINISDERYGLDVILYDTQLDLQIRRT